MFQKMITILLAVSLVFGLALTARAEESEETTGPTEPVQTEPAQPGEPAISPIPTALEIDTEHVYEGMDKAYADGYIPKVENGTVHLVLPLQSSGEIYGDKIQASLGLGSGGANPFVVANYEKTFTLEQITPKDGEEARELFLVEFAVKLSGDRENGVYPVTVNITGYDASGSPINCIYTLYVTITDGKRDTPVPTTPETPTAEPVVYISGSVMEPEAAVAGEEFALTLSLKNSLTTKSVKNMLVKVDTGSLQISLAEVSNVFQIETIAEGGEAELTLHFVTDPSIPAGKYPLNFSFDYDSSETLNLFSSGTAIVEIRQPANMELVMPRFAESVTVGETIPLSLQVMNMGRDTIYNVRCVVSGLGFMPSNTGFIGTMAAGTSAATGIDLYITALNVGQGNENNAQYGDTVGTVTLIYEDESGTEYTQETQFETTVNWAIGEMPTTASTGEEEEKTAGRWWISVLILGGVILVAGIGAVLYRRRSKRRGVADL